MWTMLGSPRRCCDGLTRRETLKAGALSALGGFGLPQMLRAEEEGHLRPGKARNVIFLFLLGGAATQDMFDMKPEGPVETRGEFRPIPSNVPGIDVCEHLPQFAKWMHKVAVVRSVTHTAGCHNCLPCYTGYDVMPPDQSPRDTDPPSMGSVLEFVQSNYPASPFSRPAGGQPPQGDFPSYVYMPVPLGWGQSIRRSGPYGGFLGKRYDALTTECTPHTDPGLNQTPGNPAPVRGAPSLPSSALQDGVTIDRLNSRRSLLQQIDDRSRQTDVLLPSTTFDRNQRRAFDVLSSSKLRKAFDLSTEDPRVVERYGNTLFGQSTLIARRLIEQGVRFVNVTWDLFWGPVKIDYDAWDTHTRNFHILKNNKLPGLDQTFSALMEDLEGRGLLDETLVVMTSEMGRTPRVNGNAGRDHWTGCYSSLLAGGGIKGGTVHGSSDAQAAYVKDSPVRPADICATIYDRLGISPEFRVLNHLGRPVEIGHNGTPISSILA